jgi:hypothetical protein
MVTIPPFFSIYLHLDNITFLQGSLGLRVGRKRGEVSNTVVDGNSGREGNTYYNNKK